MADTYGADAMGETKQRYGNIVEEGKKLLTNRGYRVSTHLALGDPVAEL